MGQIAEQFRAAQRQAALARLKKEIGEALDRFCETSEQVEKLAVPGVRGPRKKKEGEGGEEATEGEAQTQQ